MPWTIPESTQAAFRRGDRGIGVWAVQRAYNTLSSADVAADGDFGAETFAAIERFQKEERLYVDGVVGPISQRRLIERAIAPLSGIPGGLLEGFASGESGFMLAAVNHSVAGGIDCGAFQRRVYEHDYHDDAVIARAFDCRRQGTLLASSLIELHASFLDSAGTQDGYGGLTPNEKSWRLAAMDHNYPSGAAALARTPIKSLTPYWSSQQDWVTAIGAHFPDGARVSTPLEWMQLYAGVLGDVHGTKGSVTRLVTDWTL